MIGKAIMLGSVFVTHDDQTSNWTDISRHRPAPECPLWVRSGNGVTPASCRFFPSKQSFVSASGTSA